MNVHPRLDVRFSTVILTAAILAGCSSAMQAPTSPSGGSASFSGSAVTSAERVDSIVDSATLASVYVTIPTTNSIQTDLISTFPNGIFTPAKFTATFSIPSTPATCGYAEDSACNFYDGFGFSGSGKSITIDTDILHPAMAYTLMNAYSPASGQQLATIEFVGKRGATVTFPLIAGEDIRDFYDGLYANSLTNGVTGVVAKNVFQCVDPKKCLGAGATGNVHTGEAGTYRVDEQQYNLSGLKNQPLTQIILTDTYNGSSPILLGLTVEQR